MWSRRPSPTAALLAVMCYGPVSLPKIPAWPIAAQPAFCSALAHDVPKKIDDIPPPLTDNELRGIVDEIKGTIGQADSVKDLFEHARKHHVSVLCYDFRTDPLRSFSGNDPIASNSFNADPTQARVELDVVKIYTIAQELLDKKLSKDVIVDAVARLYSTVVAHEFGHHKLNVDINKKFPNIKIMLQCQEHEGIVLARQVRFLEEGYRKNFKVGQDKFNVAVLKGTLSETGLRFTDVDEKLLKAAQGGRESFKNLVCQVAPTAYSSEMEVEGLTKLRMSLSKYEPSGLQANLISADQRDKLIAAIDDTIEAYKDPVAGTKVQAYLTAAYEKELDKMANLFDWNKSHN